MSVVHSRRARGSRPRGVSIVEVLLALTVLSVGLLGAAAMLLDSLRNQASALQKFRAIHLVRDMADRILVNPRGREHYDTRLSASPACSEHEGCSIAQLAAADRAAFASAAHALFSHDNFSASVEYEPAIGPAAPDRYVITLGWSDARDPADTSRVVLQVLAQSPVAG
jgi:type IV pilus assembly protein PilV